jgi:hypothetical protein
MHDQIASGQSAAHSDLYEDMIARHGPLLTGHELFQSLGFRNAAAFRQARLRGHVDVPVFSLPNRKGVFAKTRDIAAWLDIVATQVRKEDAM